MVLKIILCCWKSWTSANVCRLTVPLKKFILKHLSKEKYLYENEKHVNDEKCLCTFIQFYLECLFALKKRIVNCYNQPRWRLTFQHGGLLQYFV